jgi:hypothetical protein
MTMSQLIAMIGGTPGVISTTQLRRWIQHHGGLIHQAEQSEVYALQERERLDDLTSLIARGRGAKKALPGQLLYRLWRGQLDNALALLEAYRPQAKDTDPLETLIKYLSDRREYLPNYKRTSSPMESAAKISCLSR